MKDIETVDVSVVMPCLNEAATLEACIAEAREALDILERRHGLTGEVIVADNGSTDGSQDIARRAGARVVDITARGYGAALRGGFEAAQGSYLVMGDSDCSYDFREAVPMIEALIAGAGLCMGSRFRGRIEPGAMPWMNRYVGNPLLSGLLRVIFNTRIGDSHCGLRALTAETFRQLKLTSEGMEFASEMVLKASIQKVPLAEVPVTLRPDKRGRPPHLKPFRDGFRHLFYMLMLSPNWLFLGPSALFAALGLLLFALLLSTPPGQMAEFAGFRFGDHWAVIASASLVVSFQTFLFALVTKVVGYRDGYLRRTGRSDRLLDASSLPNWLYFGFAAMAVGIGWAAAITAGWVGSGYGTLDQIRGLIAAFTAIVIGVQACFGGFLLSVASGNSIRHGVR